MIKKVLVCMALVSPVVFYLVTLAVPAIALLFIAGAGGGLVLPAIIFGVIALIALVLPIFSEETGFIPLLL